MVPDKTSTVNKNVVPDKTQADKGTTVPDATLDDKKNTLPDATQSEKTLPVATDSDESLKTSTKNDSKPVRGVFKTKRISMRCSKDPRTFKCSACDTHTPSLCEFNAHYIANHRNVNCDICRHAFSTPSALRKHHYSHTDEQFKCHSCD